MDGSGGGGVPPAVLQEKADAMLMESAAARSLATSGKNSQPLIPHIGTGTTNKMFDVAHERERRSQLDRLWNRSKEEETEELQLRKELRTIEAQLRKLKKSGGHLLAAASSGIGGGAGFGGLPSAASSRNPSRSVSPVNVAESSQILDQSFASTAPVPMPQNPYLQSGRLVPPATGPNGINKSLLSKMDHVLAELHVSSRPLPTKRVCDVYDAVRKDILTLVTLQKLTLQKEGTLQTKRVKLAKLGGTSLPVEDAAMDEERLLGIAPPPAPAPKPAPAPAAASGAKPKSAKKKGVGGKGKATRKAPAAAASAEGGAEVGAKSAAAATGDGAATGAAPSGKKKIVKRKRKSESGNPAPARKGGGPGKAAAGKADPAKAAPGSAAAAAAAASSASATAGGNPPVTGSAKKRARKS